LTKAPTTKWTAQAILVAGLLAAMAVGASPARGDHAQQGMITATNVICQDEDALILGIETPQEAWPEVMTPFFMTGLCLFTENALPIKLVERRETFLVPEEARSFTVWKVEDINGMILYAWEMHNIPEEGI